MDPSKITTHRTFAAIARDVKRLWKKPYFGAVPYLDALLSLETSDSSAHFGCDSAKEIAIYFLANAQGFRGEEARGLKAELKALTR